MSERYSLRTFTLDTAYSTQCSQHFTHHSLLITHYSSLSSASIQNSVSRLNLLLVIYNLATDLDPSMTMKRKLAAANNQLGFHSPAPQQACRQRRALQTQRMLEIISACL